MIAPAMNTRPPEALPYLDLARQGMRIDRQIAVSELSRLAPLVADWADNGGRQDVPVLAVSLQFGLAPDGLVRVQGEISGEIGLVCHGCAEPLPHRLLVAFDCLIVESEAAACRLDEEGPAGGRRDTLIVAGGREISLAEIVEDEILLALPERLCVADPCERAPALSYPAGAGFAEGEGVVPERRGGAENPFSVLAELKDTNETPTG